MVLNDIIEKKSENCLCILVGFEYTIHDFSGCSNHYFQ